MRLGIKFTLITSIVVGVVLASYGYHTISKRRNILLSRMKREARAIARTAKINIEEASHRKGSDIQALVNGIGEFQKTLGVFVKLDGKTFQSESLKKLPHSFEKNMEFGKQVAAQGEGIERFGRYGKTSIFAHFEPLRGRQGEIVGVLGIIQHTSFVEEDIVETRLGVMVTMVVLILLITASILLLIRINITGPISGLIKKIRRVGRGEFDTEVRVNPRDELGELDHEFNQMAANLREAERGLLEEADRKAELEQRMRHMERLATIGQLASGLAHEIGTPLNVIGGRAIYIKKRVNDQESMDKNLDVIVRQSQRITKIIKHLLNFSRKNPPQLIPTEVPSVMDSTLDLLGNRIRRQGVRVAKSFPPDLPFVEGDPEQLQQVFLNIMLNAVQAMPSGGELILEGRVITDEGRATEQSQPKSVEIQIRDTGVGMKPDVFENIFKPFFTTKWNGRGTGLGLPISHGIVRDHGGNIHVTTEEGKGTTVRICLPCLNPSSDMGQTQG
jgi:two-component system NtrC family sensor kinase